ncbi:hypothetical protein P691DRAFT_808244 [Macrolepiota fuliginosa MF-IS2]|uniref:DUF1279 domain-containing protein n=1 Tax=Macrolepiota fuliginosa MF-IS2 TaxID=1400762 RepID=A0A9P6C4G6_9AGAR|nr:hypothetical protein P691DRAFT_808244 [Macrolepiota fuliginosa MF-IS2]
MMPLPVVRGILPRMNFLRLVVPRVTAPLLPTTARARGMLTSQPRNTNSRLFHHFPARLTNSPPPSPHPSSDPLPQNSTLSQRLKHLIKSYGWYALGVYLILSALDFGVAFVGINLLGAEYVSRIATQAKNLVHGMLHSKPAEPGLDEIDRATHNNSGGSEGLWAMLVLAYTVHKTLFLPVRVGLTAAFTPRLVGWLRQRGWAGGVGTRRAVSEVREMLRERRNRD